MSPAHVLEPAYLKLKRMLIEGRWPPGERLEALRLADELGVSMTPVRDCLNRLVGERLVDMKPGEGYRVPFVSEKTLRDMLELNAMLLDLAIKDLTVFHKAADITPEEGDYADRVAALFDTLARRSANLMVTEVVRSLSDRMHSYRMLDPELFAHSSQEIEELEHLAGEDDLRLRRRIRNHHLRRIRKVVDLIELRTVASPR